MTNPRFDALHRGLEERMEPSNRFDAGESAIMERKLTHTLAKVQETIYSEAIAQQAIPVAAPEGTGLTAIEYYTADQTGEMQLIGPGSKDLPRIDETMTKETKSVANYGGAFGYHLIEFERVARQGMSFDQRRALAARKIAERKIDAVTFSESDTARSDIKGLFGYALNSTSGLTGGWGTATEVEILDDLKLLWQEAYNGSGGEMEPNACILPSSLYGLLKSTFRTNTDRTLLKLFGDELGVTFYRSARLNSVTSATNSLTTAPTALMFKRDPEVVEMHIPRPFQLRPGYWNGLEYTTPFLLDYAGVFVYLPSFIAFGDLS